MKKRIEKFLDKALSDPRLLKFKKKSFIELFAEFPGLQTMKALEMYPPFFLMGVKFPYVAIDHTSLTAVLPLKWYSKNLNGTMFGGNMASLADPLPAVMCGKIFKNTTVWSKKIEIEFLRPGATDLEMKIFITPEQIATIGEELEQKGRANPQFEFFFMDKQGKKVARVLNTAAVILNQKKTQIESVQE